MDVQTKKSFFNLFALVKYVLETKANIPFPKEDFAVADVPWKKPEGYAEYDDTQDRKDHQLLETKLKDEMENRVKNFHFHRKKFESRAKGILNLSSIRHTGQHTISFRLLALLKSKFEQEGIVVEYKRKNIFSLFPKTLKKSTKGKLSAAARIFGSIFLRRYFPDYYTFTFIENDAFISVNCLLFKAERYHSFISIIEHQFDDKNGDILFPKMESIVDQIIRKLPLMDIIDELPKKS